MARGGTSRTVLGAGSTASPTRHRPRRGSSKAAYSQPGTDTHSKNSFLKSSSRLATLKQRSAIRGFSSLRIPNEPVAAVSEDTTPVWILRNLYRPTEIPCLMVVPTLRFVAVTLTLLADMRLPARNAIGTRRQEKQEMDNEPSQKCNLSKAMDSINFKQKCFRLGLIQQRFPKKLVHVQITYCRPQFGIFPHALPRRAALLTATGGPTG